MTLRYPIQYLERSDFTSSGDLVPSLQKKPIFVMFQADGCFHCTNSKPDFQRLADSKFITCMTIQGDGTTPGEQALKPLIPKIYPGIVGYPSYMLFSKGRKIPYTGGRDMGSMKRFIQANI